MKIIETERLILRKWQKEDAEPYYLINQDSKVIEFFSGSKTTDQVSSFIQACNNEINSKNYGLFAAELKETSNLIGFIGLSFTGTDFNAPFTPAVEVGWRLGSQFWGKGYATEGARACLDYGFNKLDLKEIVSFTYHLNLRSIAVMERLGMNRDLNGDFNHPQLAPDHPISKHVLYRITKG